MPKRKALWKTLRSKIAYKNPFIQIREDQVIRPDGKPGIYGVLQTRGNAVFIMAINDKNEVCCVEQFRYPTKHWSLEIPSGNSERQHDLTAARRELWEETGLKAKQWKKIGGYYSSNGLSDEWMAIFIARDLTQTGTNKQLEDGIISAKFYPLKQVLGLVKKGKIMDGQSLAALLLLTLELDLLKSK